jgi:hypothetical protein
MKYAELQMCHSMALDRHALALKEYERRLRISTEEKERLEEALRIKDHDLKSVT